MEQGTFDFPDEPTVAPVKLCECGCGQPTAILTYNDKRDGYAKGQPRRFVQGHWTKNSLLVKVGQRFGLGVVIETELRAPTLRKHGTDTFRAARLICDCGIEYISRLDVLVRGGCLSCGCKRGRPGGIADPEYVARNRVLITYKKNAELRGFAWELTKEDFGRLVLLDCHYCGQPPSKVIRHRAARKDGRGQIDSVFATNGLDRVDNTRGYTPDNVVPCCEICNRAKHALSYDEFMAWVGRLTEHQWFHPEQLPSRLLKRGA